jgi:hypothetical protein
MPRPPRQGRRSGKTQLSGMFENVDAYTVQEVLGRVSRKRNRRMTVQEIVYEAVADWCAREGTILPTRQLRQQEAPLGPGPA